MSFYLHLQTDISDSEREAHTPPPVPVPSSQEQAALNYSTLAATAAAIGGNVPQGQDPNLSSTETLLRNIQGLLKVAADNARQQERQISYEKGEFLSKFRQSKTSFIFFHFLWGSLISCVFIGSG